jgi:3-dehydroquinate synthase
MRIVKVNTRNNTYDIRIGLDLLEHTGQQLRDLGFSNKIIFITDTIVGNLYADKVEYNLKQNGFEVTSLVIPPGEKQKSLRSAGNLYIRLCVAHAERNTPIVALGGGVIGDLAGFVAATYMRGIPIIQIPTTLLAQVDSSIGGKVAVNSDNLKNMIGAFYQPKLVISDINVLKTLDSRQIGNGLAEIIKYGVIRDANFVSYIEKNLDSIRALNNDIIEETVSQSVQIKTHFIELDEQDLGARQMLNFGHTFGHGIESASNFKISHGEAVALGMIAAAKISFNIGILEKAELTRIGLLIKNARLPFKMPTRKIDGIIQALTHDKKIVNGKIKFVLIKGIGNALMPQDIDIKTIEQTLINWNE